MDQIRHDTNVNKDSSTEKAFFEVLDVCCFPLPEKTGEVVGFQNDIMVPDVVTDTAVISSVFRGDVSDVKGFTEDHSNHMKVGRGAYRKRRCRSL